MGVISENDRPSKIDKMIDEVGFVLEISEE